MTGIRAHLAQRYPLDFGGDIAKTVLVSGEGRSGTTWLADLINFDQRYRDLFEPFHPWKVPAAQALKGRWYQRPGETPPPEFTAYVDRVLRGRIRHPWVDRFNRRPVSRARIVKAIRANLFIGWLAERHPELKVLLLLRHPAGVARSRMRLHEGWVWRPTLQEALLQPSLKDDLNEAQWSRLTRVDSVFQNHVGSWCLANWAALRHLPEGRALVVRYEDIQQDAERQLRRIFEHLGREWDPNCLAAHQRPSRTTRNRMPLTGAQELSQRYWGEGLAAEERAWAEAAMAEFGLDSLYPD